MYDEFRFCHFILQVKIKTFKAMNVHVYPCDDFLEVMYRYLVINNDMPMSTFVYVIKKLLESGTYTLNNSNEYEFKIYRKNKYATTIRNYDNLNGFMNKIIWFLEDKECEKKVFTS